MKPWIDCKDLVCFRTDHLGDLLMTLPALRALKQSFGCRITLVTSSAAADLVSMVPEVDEVLVFDAPWCYTHTEAATTAALIGALSARTFDAAVIFTVYSQSPLPAAMAAYMAGIPRRLAYCRENPYSLLTHWVPDREPYQRILHQVPRDLALVRSIGAVTRDDRLRLDIPEKAWTTARQKIASTGLQPDRPWIILHPGVSEKKREYEEAGWIAAGRHIRKTFGWQLLLTGNDHERALTQRICRNIGRGAFQAGGLLTLPEFAAAIAHALLVISVNTATIHLATATRTPQVVLYALTNPQHTPWKSPCRVLPFHPPLALQSQNQVVVYAYDRYLKRIVSKATTEEILHGIRDLLAERWDTESMGGGVAGSGTDGLVDQGGSFAE